MPLLANYGELSATPAVIGKHVLKLVCEDASFLYNAQPRRHDNDVSPVPGPGAPRIAEPRPHDLDAQLLEGDSGCVTQPYVIGEKHRHNGHAPPSGE